MIDDPALPEIQFAFPGPLRDKLVAAVLSGAKTSTTSLRLEFDLPSSDEEFPVVGARGAVVDSAGRRVAVVATTAVEVLRLADVGWEHARDEGEGYASVAEWRAAHERFWNGPEMREWLGDPSFAVTDGTLVVAERFRVVERPGD
ncbi:ASCH domain-containing protein [Streptomyces sp. NPDC051940]|uniref:ASCH domain-containing protein n=1 Tax=Streptomyces sp. NPDC051940 TaxID=3155675 RepID=UPI0034395FA6